MELSEKKKEEDEEAPERKGVNGKRKRGGEDNGMQRAVTEEEVNEFFSIIRSVRMAAKYFEKGKRNDSGSELTAYKPSVEWEDPDGLNGITKVVRKAQEANKGLDLNLDPDDKCDMDSLV